MPRPFEYAVIGGGPGGASVARVLAARGREVVIVCGVRARDRRHETLPGKARPFLETLGLSAELTNPAHMAVPGTIVAWGDDEARFEDALFDPEGESIMVDRAALESACLAGAADAGCVVLAATSVREVCCEQPGWRIVVDGEAAESVLRARTLIDAAGRRPFRGRPGRRLVFDRQVACVATYAPSVAAAFGRRTIIEARERGWWFSGVGADGVRTAIYFTDGDCADVARARTAEGWHSLIDETNWVRSAVAVAGKFMGSKIVPASTTLGRPAVGEGYVAVGDAASTIDPLSSHGVFYAIETGLAAADALLAPNRRAALRRYAVGVARRLRDDLEMRRTFAVMERRWPQSAFWRRRATPVALEA